MAPTHAAPAKGARAPKRLRFLDIGFGGAERIASYQRRPRSKRRFFIGIEKKKSQAATFSRQHNVKLMFGDAQARIKGMPPKSLDVINMDFFPLTEIKSKIVGFSMTGPHLEYSVKEAFPGLISQVKRVLQDRGKFCLTVPRGAIGDVNTYLGLNGFEISLIKDVPERQKTATEAMKAHFDMAKQDSSARPCTVVAVKAEQYRRKFALRPKRQG